jgi:hypothetical protein
MVRYLEQEDVIQRNGAVNTAKLEPVLRNLLGEAPSPILHSLLMVQKKSPKCIEVGIGQENAKLGSSMDQVRKQL